MKLCFRSEIWYRSLKCVSLLYQWKLINNYDSIIKLLKVYLNWSQQTRFQNDTDLLNDLLSKWPFKYKEVRIWACMHVGPYAIVVRALINMEYKVAILLRSDVFEEQMNIYKKQYQLSFGREAAESDLLFIKSDVGNPLLRLKDAILKGYQVVIFIDGHIGNNENAKGWQSVKLYGSTVNLREGVAALSHWTNTPITTLMLSLVDEKINVRYKQNELVKHKTDYQNVLQNIFGFIHCLATEELIQWEYLPVIFEKRIVSEEKKHNSPGIWLPLLIQNKEMLFDVTTGRSVLINQSDFDKISKKFKEQFFC
ncbi:hypothetical protein [Sphingobacterium sp. DR205]|uniref:hypothetical protein n=1 Tax=Sphingobacterium sp. DR205 TaxID=2713573 RepID=UPI0013E49F24|nr:hypothetical protein [Sphingobacterium sp. DR205]QIH35897.1 hypothetical protein G6053_24820 [Sphingobacterium sp. DR205]